MYLTFYNLLKKFKEYRFSYGSESTHDRIKQEINLYIIPFFSDKLVTKLKEKDFKPFYNHLKESSLKDKQRVLNLLIRIFDFLESAYGYHCVYPYRLPKFDSNINLNFLNLDDNFYRPLEALDMIEKMVEDTPYHFFQKLCVSFCIFGCTRISEMRGLKWNCYKDGYVTIHDQLYRGRLKELKSKLSYRSYRLLDFLIEMMDKWKKITLFPGKENFIFIHPKTKKVVSPQSIRRWIQDVAEENNKKYFYPHKGRHTIASFIRQVGGDEYIMGQILGHSPSVAKQIYAHAFNEEKNKMVDLMNKALKKK